MSDETHWPDGTLRSQSNAFTQAWGGQRIDVAKMATNAKISRNTSRTVTRHAALGKNLGMISGMSRKADEKLRTNDITRTKDRKGAA